MPLVRHQLVWVNPQAWWAALIAQPFLSGHPLLKDWADNGWPLIARSPVCDDMAEMIPLGLPLPPAHGKLRLSFRFPAHHIVRTAPPPRLADAVCTAPAHWHEVIAAILALDAETRCFGSLAWQHLTGLAYLSPASDLDLLWQAETSDRMSHLACALAGIAGALPVRIDGEFVSPAGRAVQWREWQSAAPELLVKSIAGVQLMARADMFA